LWIFFQGSPALWTKKSLDIRDADGEVRNYWSSRGWMDETILVYPHYLKGYIQTFLASYNYVYGNLRSKGLEKG
jgi:hypothetical protein